MEIWRTRDISTNDGLERDDLCLFHEHRAPLKRLPVHLDLGGHLADVGGDEVCGNDMPELLEPEERNLREHLALVWYALSIPAGRSSSCAAGVVSHGQK